MTPLLDREYAAELLPEYGEDEFTPSAPTAAQLRANIVRVAEQEHARWNRPVTLRERDPRVRAILTDYWRTGGRFPVNPASLGSVEFQKKHPWSAAFISWVMHAAGAAPPFRRSAKHAVYIVEAKRNRLTNNGNPFRAYRVSEVRPQVGDLVCKERNNSGATYDTIQSHMDTHCDIVVGVGPRSITVIGGNTSNAGERAADTVGRRTVALTADGRLAPPGFFAVLRLDDRSAPVPGPTPPPTPAPSVGGGQTLYEPIDLGIVVNGARVRPQTGIFIPPGWRPDPAVSLVVFFHGIRQPDAPTIDRYWDAARDRRLNLREEFAAAGKNAVLVAPLLGPRSQTQIGRLAAPGGLDGYCRAVLAAVQRAGRLGANARVGNLTFACHSGGGLAMRTTALATNALAPAIAACWGFDCTYNRDDHIAWPRWARLRPSSRLVMRYITNSLTAPAAERLRAVGLPNVEVLPSRTRDHGAVPQAHFRPLLAAAAHLPPR